MIGRATEWVLTVLARLPTTNARIAVSLILATATGVRVLITWDEPPWSWLLFLGAMMGLDLAQFAAKRMTHRNGATETPKPGTP